MRIGILSTFYHNYNYGGKLQAFALVEILRQFGHDACQISYGQHKGSSSKREKLHRLFTDSDYRISIFQKILWKLLKKRISISDRKAAFVSFDAEIPHTEQVYTDANLAEACNAYDVFICGSDQIWNPQLVKKGYLLDFVPKNKWKFSYAAGVSAKIDDAYSTVLQETLCTFNAISVRESDTAQQLTDVLKRTVETTADPTMLLTRDQWERLLPKEKETGRYLFCYFLGYSRKMRKSAVQYANQHHLQIVTLPHMLGLGGRCYFCDLGFGDRQLYDVSPLRFLTLIRDAEFIMTDSFHATVFSILFRKQFVVYNRTGHDGMRNRMSSLLQLFDLENRHCVPGQEPQNAIIYQDSYEKAEQLREHSLSFIRTQLDCAERNL